MALTEKWYIYEEEKMLTGSKAFCLSLPTDEEYGNKFSLFNQYGYDTKEEALADLERILRKAEYFKYSSYFVLPRYSVEH